MVFAWLASQAPHILLLDEPTNHLDMETIDALAEAIKDFDGGLMLVSHDFRLINQVNYNSDQSLPSPFFFQYKRTATVWRTEHLIYLVFPLFYSLGVEHCSHG